MMSPTVQEIRNEIRNETDRFEREFAASFTKEELRAICNAFEIKLSDAERPTKTRMRQLIRVEVGIAGSLDLANDGTFWKSDLESIAEALETLSERDS